MSSLNLMRFSMTELWFPGLFTHNSYSLHTTLTKVWSRQHQHNVHVPHCEQPAPLHPHPPPNSGCHVGDTMQIVQTLLALWLSTPFSLAANAQQTNGLAQSHKHFVVIHLASHLFLILTWALEPTVTWARLSHWQEENEELHGFYRFTQIYKVKQACIDY